MFVGKWNLCYRCNETKPRCHCPPLEAGGAEREPQLTDRLTRHQLVSALDAAVEKIKMLEAALEKAKQVVQRADPFAARCRAWHGSAQCKHAPNHAGPHWGVKDGLDWTWESVMCHHMHWSGGSGMDCEMAPNHVGDHWNSLVGYWTSDD